MKVETEMEIGRVRPKKKKDIEGKRKSTRQRSEKVVQREGESKRNES